MTPEVESSRHASELRAWSSFPQGFDLLETRSWGRRQGDLHRRCRFHRRYRLHMTVSSLLALTPASTGSLFSVLAIAFAVAVVIWLILWKLEHSGIEEETNGSSGSVRAKGEVGQVEAAIATSMSKPKLISKPKSAAHALKSDSRVEPKSEVPSAARMENAIAAVSEKEAAMMFAEELASGLVTQDPAYGIIYKTAPGEADDLKKIKGVAKVLEGKLNGIGVYRFKQVAVWTDAACAEFSKLLTFKDRIYRDDWIAQAKAFHEEKYGEKL